MPQSLAAVYIHLIFSTKERYLYLRDEKLQTDLHAYLGEISKRLECPPIRVVALRIMCISFRDLAGRSLRLSGLKN